MAIWAPGETVGGVLNTVSNLAILPGVAYAALHGDWATVILFTHTFVASNLYHMCRAGFLCLYGFKSHQRTDFVFVYRSVVWVLSHIATRTRREQVAVYFFFSGPAFLAIEATGGDHPLSPVVGVCLPVLFAIVLGVARRRRMVTSVWLALLGGGLMGAGSVLLFFAPAEAYWWAHPLWHVLSMGSTFVSLMAVRRRKRRRHEDMERSQ